MKVRYRGNGTKRYQCAGRVYEIPSETWLEVDNLRLFNEFRKYPSVFDTIAFYDTKPFEIIAEHLTFKSDLVFCSYLPAVNKLKKLPFVREQACKPEKNLHIFRILKYSGSDFDKYKDSSRLINVLIMRSLGGIGDIVMTTPVVEVTKRRFPHFKITYSCPDEFVDVIRENPFASVVPISKINKQDDWDIVLDLTRDCIKHEMENQPNVKLNRSEVFMESAGLGSASVVRPKFYLTQSEIAKAKSELKSFGHRLKIGVALEANAMVRRWSHINKLRTALTNVYPNSLILEVSHSKPPKWQHTNNVYGVFGRTLREVAALINECDVYISADTGLAHIAAALRVPTVWIFTHIDGSIRTRNYDQDLTWVVKSDYQTCPIKQPCWYMIPCSGSVDRLEQTTDPPCSVNISIAQVVDAVASALSRPTLSYCVVYHNQLEMTKSCLNHIAENIKYSDEIVLVDNGSSQPIWYDNQQLRHYHIEANEGCVIGRNKAMKEAKGRFLLTLDNDQFISCDTVHKLMRIDADVVGVEAWSMDSSGYAFDIRQNRGSLAYVGAGGMLVKKSVAEKIGYFTSEYAPAWFEDPDFCNKAKSVGYSIGYELESGIQHLKHQTVLTQKSFDSDAAWKKSHTLYQKMWSGKRISTKPSVLLIADVLGWAWDYKSRQLAKYLSDSFDIQIFYFTYSGSARCDVALAYDCESKYFNIVDYNKKITGVTAHVYVNFKNFEHTLRDANAVHANSLLLYNEVKQYNPNAYYVPNGVDEDLFRVQQSNKGEFVIGFVGKQTKRKGFDEFVLPACRKADVKLLSLTSKYNEDGRIKFEDMPNFYKQVNAIIIASDMDGTPNQLLEAAACGRPCISNKIGNVPEFVTHGVNGIIVNRSVDEYADAIQYLKSYPGHCEEMGLKARETVEHGWTWKIQSNNYRRMFNEVVSQK